MRLLSFPKHLRINFVLFKSFKMRKVWVVSEHTKCHSVFFLCAVLLLDSVCFAVVLFILDPQVFLLRLGSWASRFCCIYLYILLRWFMLGKKKRWNFLAFFDESRISFFSFCMRFILCGLRRFRPNFFFHYEFSLDIPGPVIRFLEAVPNWRSLPSAFR